METGRHVVVSLCQIMQFYQTKTCALQQFAWFLLINVAPLAVVTKGSKLKLTSTVNLGVKFSFLINRRKHNKFVFVSF